MEELATLFAGSSDAAEERLSATAAACTSGDCAADPLQTVRALHYAIFAIDAVLREALNSTDSSGSGSGAADNGANTTKEVDAAGPQANQKQTRIQQLAAHLEVLLTDAAGHVVAEVARAKDVGLVDGGTVSVAVALIGEEALWLGMCCQVRCHTRGANGSATSCRDADAGHAEPSMPALLVLLLQSPTE